MAKGTKGMHCIRKQKVRVKGHGMQLRCAKFGRGKKGRR